ncbi:hypothetical protein BY996DRAFT_1299331 [Phakopsora pachyrhizi]|nr:hypothetical protein BY996DRAFT_1299331 [Phakopsora pachyrhizi]
MTDHHHQEISSKPSYQSSTIGSLSINATTISSAASTTTSKSNSLIDPSSKTTPLGSSSSTPTSSSSSTSSSSAVAEGEATTTVTAINSDNAASELYLSSSPSRLKTPDDDQDTTIQQSENHPDHPLNQPIIRPIQPQSHQTQQSTPRSSSSPLVDPILSNKLFSSQPSNPSTSALSSVYSPLNPLSALLTPITPLPKQSAIPFFNKTVQQNSQLSSPRQQPSQTLPVIPDELLLALSREQNPHHHIQPAPSSPLSQPTISGLSSSSPAPDPRSSHLPYPQAQPPNNHKSSSNPLIQRKSSPLISNPRSNSHTPVRSKISKIVATVTTSTAASLSSSSPASQPQPHPSSAWDHSPARDSSQHHLRNLSADLSSPASRPSLDHHPNPAGDSSSSGLGSLLRSSLHRSLGFLPDIPTTPITLDLDHDRHPSQSSEPQCTAIDPPESSRLNDLHRQPNLDLFNPSLAESADPGPSRSASNHLIPSTLSNHPCSAFETPTQSIEHTLLSNAPSSHQLSSISATSSVTPRHNLRSEQPNIGKSFGAGVKSLFHLRSSHSQPNHSKPDTSTSTQPFNPQSSSKSTSSVNRRYKNLNAGNSGADITESQPALSSTLLSSPETSQNSTSVTPTLILLPLNATAPLVSSPLLYSSLNLPVNQKVQDSSDTAQSDVLPPSPISPLREPNAAPSSPSMSSSGLFGAARSSKKSQGGQSGQIPVHSDSSKVKDTIWNRMGFSSGSSVSQPHSTSSSAKRGFLRQPHTQNSGSSSNSKLPLTSQGEKHVKHSSPSTRVSHGARSRASFSFDHKAHTQLVNTDESQSKPFGFFSYSHSSENYRTDYKDLSSKPSKRRSKPTRSELVSD